MVEIKNLTRQKVKQNLIIKKVEEILLKERADNWDISICLVGCAKIKELNRRFRRKNSSTDVLSFTGLEIQGSKKRVGEVFICLKEVANNARKSGLSIQKTLDWAVVHAILHLLGYDHEKSSDTAAKMSRKEQEYAKISN
ncbi:MAG: rRNA maturation RNase YbeY [Candidatus Pacebacteria bacterium]|nr:rRNA maturation RNase YbeY [Candidatus Paceibacterota bacterium]